MIDPLERAKARAKARAQSERAIGCLIVAGSVALFWGLFIYAIWGNE